jgi:uncharacterized membrane protein YphA (DoxX/SURF4 family)
VKSWIGLVVRLVVGAVWVVAGLAKLPDPAGSVRSVRAYQLLPESVVPTVGHLLPMLEIVIGALLILGLLTRVFAVVAGLLFAAFIIGISSAWIRGLEINCGCFGSSGVPADPQRQYAIDIARDAALFVGAAWLVVWPRTRLALDNLLFPSPSERFADGEEQERSVEV